MFLHTPHINSSQPFASVKTDSDASTCIFFCLQPNGSSPPFPLQHLKQELLPSISGAWKAPVNTISKSHILRWPVSIIWFGCPSGPTTIAAVMSSNLNFKPLFFPSVFSLLNSFTRVNDSSKTSLQFHFSTGNGCVLTQLPPLFHHFQNVTVTKVLKLYIYIY